MKRELAVMNSDRVNRYGSKFSVSSLLKAVGDSWGVGSPILFSHDYHRPTGWVRPFGIHIEPGQTRLVGILDFAEDAAEMSQIYESLNIFLARNHERVFEKFKDEFNELIKSKISGDFKFCLQGEIGILKPGVVRDFFPELFSEQDKNGLIDLRQLDEMMPGVYKVGKYAIFAHRFFRRSLSYFNTMNEPFLRAFSELKKDPELKVRIAIDEDLIGLSSSIKWKGELEYWRGPHFTNDLSKIKKGVSVHGADESQKLYHGILRTEFWWKDLSGERSFECEEILNIPSYGESNDDFGCRYAHSLLDPTTSIPNHLDGAIRLYNIEKMAERIDENTDISKFGKDARYVKLWRVDGPLEVPKWKSLISDHFRFNVLIGEYFDGETGKPSVGPALIKVDSSEDQNTEFIPVEMQNGMGIRIAVSLFEKPKDILDGITISPRDLMKRGDESFEYFEHSTFEIIKLLRKSGTPVYWKSDVRAMCYKDSIVNYPLFLHTGSKATSLASETWGAFCKLFKFFKGEKDDRLFSFNIGLELSGTMVLISVAGHLEDICKWLESEVSKLPVNFEQLPDWCEANSKWSSQTFSLQNDNPPLEKLLQKSGILLFKRQMANPEHFKIMEDDSGEKTFPPVAT